MSEKVKIKDSAGNTFVVEVDTCNFIRLAFELKRNGNNRLWRPHVMGGDWEVVDQGYITPSSGDVWYSRGQGDFRDGREVGDVSHLDVYLHKAGDKSADYYGMTLYSFRSLNGTDSSGGSGYLDQPFALQAKAGPISWDIPSRYRSA
jgi:hypothetical protein